MDAARSHPRHHHGGKSGGRRIDGGPPIDYPDPLTQYLHAITGGNLLARDPALWDLPLCDFWATLHAVLLYDRGLAVAYPATVRRITDGIRNQITAARAAIGPTA